MRRLRVAYAIIRTGSGVVWSCSMVKRPISDFNRKAAKTLRANTTAAEDNLWRHLRRLEVKGSHFRRQVPIGPYVADFACLKARLIIEVDGSQHGNYVDSRRDEVRKRWLNSEGYRVVRFWNNDVMSKTEAVLEAIYDAIAVTPPRLPLAGDPPPPGEGGE
jgi:very-short-patch-repair endonuclease